MNAFRILLAAAVLVISPAGATVLPANLMAAVEAFDAAQVHGDRAALDSLLADDYLLLNGDGSEEDRTAFIRDFTKPEFHLDPFEVRSVMVRAWPGGAVMGGVVRLTGQEGGKPFDHCIRFSDIWALRKGRWQVAYTQVSRPPEGACAAASPSSGAVK